MTRQEFLAVQGRATANQHSRQGPDTDERTVPGTEYLYRGLLHCGSCGLRMWATIGAPTTTTPASPPTQRSANIPGGRPKTVYLNEDKLNEALFAYLRSAI